MNKYCLLSNDVETTSIWFNKLRPETGLKVLREGMPALLDLYQKYNVRTTFFFCGDIVNIYPEVVKMVLPYNHEIASHGWSHDIHEAFDVLSLELQIEHLRKSKDVLENISGKMVTTFRAPALRVNNNTAIALEECGFKIDSSVASQRFDMFLSFGGIKKLKWLIAPRKPYITSPDNLFIKGNGNITEVPLSAFLLPYTSTTMRIFPRITQLQTHFADFEYKIHNKPIVFDIHPNELIDESDEKRIISRRSKSSIGYLFGDLLRSNLKTKNLGINALQHYEKILQFYKKKNYCFIPLNEYVENELNNK